MALGNSHMRTHLIRIGNSIGIRLPKPLLVQAGLSEEVDLQVQEGSIIIARISAPRTGWAEAAKMMSQNQDDRLLDHHRPTKFDETGWKW